MKTIEQHFKDWESFKFGYGYGTGEEHTIPVLKKFFDLCINDSKDSYPRYDYRILEKELSPQVTWLLINILCQNSAQVEYGSSPRFGWLTNSGRELKEFFSLKSLQDIYDIIGKSSNHNYCYPDKCYCCNEDRPGRMCLNPFWEKIVVGNSLEGWNFNVIFLYKSVTRLYECISWIENNYGLIGKNWDAELGYGIKFYTNDENMKLNFMKKWKS